MPGPDEAIKLQDLSLQHPQLCAESRNAGSGDLGQPLVIRIGDDSEQLVHTFASNRSDDAELRKVRTDCIDTEVCWRMNK